METGPKFFGVSWYGADASIAQTGYIFTAEEASKVAQDGAEAPDFWEWAHEQEFTIDELSDGSDLPVVRADAETEPQRDEFTAWEAPNDDVIRILSDQDCPGCGWPECVAVGRLSTGPEHLECARREPCGWSAPVERKEG